MKVDLSRASLFAAVLIVFAGYLIVFAPAEATIAERYVQLTDTRATLERSLAFAKRIPALERERAAFATGTVGAHAREPRVVMVERFLRIVAGIATHDAIAVQRVAADTRQTPYAPTPAVAAPLFEELPFDLTLRGRYEDIIRAVRDMDGADILTRITLASLSDAARRPGERPLLNAAFHVFLLREADDSTTHVRAR